MSADAQARSNMSRGMINVPASAPPVTEVAGAASNRSRTRHPSAIVNAMTVDVEDYFQVSAFERYVSRDAWPSIECRVEANVNRILAKFDEAGVKATFFTLGWVAKRFPEMTCRIVAEGHELASHGWEHRRVTTQDEKAFSEDVGRAKHFLEDLGGAEVTGYRAPSYSINGANHQWAHATLARHGYRYSSSIAPIDHDLYGWPGASADPFPVAGGAMLEVPISTVAFGSRNIACGGGGWFRLYPYALTRYFASHINSEGKRYIFYFHPWEIDPGQPRVAGIDAKTRFRHYLNLHRVERRIERLLSDFRWDRMDRVFAHEIAGLESSATSNEAHACTTPVAMPVLAPRLC